MMEDQAPITPLGARTPHAHPALYAVIGVLSAIIVAGAAWVFWPWSAVAPEPSPVVSSSLPTPSANSLNVGPDINGWRTYTNDAFGYSFAFPSADDIAPLDTAIPSSGVAVSAKTTAEYIVPGESYSLLPFVSIVVEATDVVASSALDWYAPYYADRVAANEADGNPPYINVGAAPEEYRATSVGGQPGIVAQYTQFETGIWDYYVLHAGTVYHIQFGKSGTIDTQYMETFDANMAKLLSSFRFIN